MASTTGRSGSEAYKVAECLKGTLKAQLRSKAVPTESEPGLLKAIRLCERFATHSKGSQTELLSLLKDVKKVFNPAAPPQVGTRAGSAGGTLGGTGILEDLTRDANKAKSQDMSPKRPRDSLDVDMPPLRLEARAHLRGSEYDHMVLLQDRRAKMEDAEAAKRRAERQAALGASLQSQLGEMAARRLQLRRERDLEAASLAAKLAEFESEEDELLKRKKEEAAALKKSYDIQLEEVRRKAAADGEEKARQATLERRQLDLEEQQALVAKAQKAAADTAEAAQQQEANRKLMAERAAEQERRRQDEREYGRRYQDMLKGWEEARAANAAAFLSKSKAAFEAAGGAQLCKRLEEQAKADEEKAAREQAQKAARDEADAAARKHEKKSRECATVAALNSQMAERKRRQEEERQADRKAAEAALLQRQLEIERAKQAAAEERARKQAELMEKKDEMRREIRARFELATGALQERERRFHTNVISGERPALNYLSSLA